MLTDLGEGVQPEAVEAIEGNAPLLEGFGVSEAGA
jgi:hypothetical protein